VIRFVLHLPEYMDAADAEAALAKWREAANQRAAVTVAVAAGITVQDLGLHFRGVPPIVRRARALHR
jgi:hypothetical protein